MVSGHHGEDQRDRTQAFVRHNGIRKEEIIMGSQAGDPKSREEQTTTTVYHANSTGRVEIQIRYFKKSSM